MGMTWTEEQQQVIELRERNLLVSAAAGSGKTAVLVERIIQKITGGKGREKPVDIDRLLIVTFTNAAAAEMRERIGIAIEKALEEQPGNTHLQRQQTLLHNAQITTIHSFCLHVIRNYFHRIELNPDFRVAEEGELKLLKSDVLDKVLEEYYKEAKPEFLALSETIAPGKNDLPLKDAILKLFDFAMSYPWVEQWLLECKKPYAVTKLEEFEALPIAAELEAYLKNLTGQWAEQMRLCLRISMEEDGPDMYAPMISQEAEGMKALSERESYGQFYEAIRSFSFGRLPSSRKFAGDPAKKEQVQKLRNEVKASMKKVTEQFFFQSPERMIEDMHKNQPIADMLVEVTLSFINAFAEKKRDKNMLDFNDLEHFALKILVDEESYGPTRTAMELQKNYEEIMIDEYQDSNYVQETILKAVSGEGKNRKNIFMVGDVKQSIYRFRMARPELFMEKYNTYTLEESENQRVDLHKNFRSRTNVLDTVNDIFYRIMKADIGNITYDKQAALYPGADFPQGASGMFDTKLLVIEPEESNKDVKERELEARAVGNEIRSLMKNQQVLDKETGVLRPVKYSDIVILLRSLSGWSDTFMKSLGEMGIPAKATTGTGYFSAIEVQTSLNLLRILDNPRQDIPMASVLASPLAGLSGEDLAILRTAYPGRKFYQAVMDFGEEFEKQKQAELTEQKAAPSEQANLAEQISVEHKIFLSMEKQQKLYEFLQLLQKYRKKVSYMPIHELLYAILEETGYKAYVFALPGGEVKKANLEMLIEKAIAYESTSYRGLFYFIRYMEQLQKYDVDFALADGEETEDMVRIMSIHKSKGLEFPVVFVSGLGKMFNTQDTRERVVLHPQLGIGMDVTDIKRRIKTPGLTRQFLARKVNMENIGEELRVLYVALTRAKEKLILTGTMKKAEEKLEDIRAGSELMKELIFESLKTNSNEQDMEGGKQEDGGAKQEQQRFLPFLSRLSSNTFLQFILMAVTCYGDKYPVTLMKQSELEEVEMQAEVKEEVSRIQLLAELQNREPEWEEQVKQRLSYVYPYEYEVSMRTKLSVSELKHRAMDKILAEEEPVAWSREETSHYIPAFMEGIQEENIGAKRGTAMHRILECYDFTREPETLKEQMQQLLEQQRMEKDMTELIYLPSLKKFLKTSLAVRMSEAARAGKLYKEKPFVMGKPASETQEDVKSQEMVLIQGIIDVFFEEKDGIVLLDYKTDRVKTGQELADRYRTQLELYQEAIERATGKKVKEKLLYSFCLGEVVML